VREHVDEAGRNSESTSVDHVLSACRGQITDRGNAVTTNGYICLYWRTAGAVANDAPFYEDIEGLWALTGDERRREG